MCVGNLAAFPGVSWSIPGRSLVNRLHWSFVIAISLAFDMVWFGFSIWPFVSFSSRFGFGSLGLTLCCLLFEGVLSSFLERTRGLCRVMRLRYSGVSWSWNPFISSFSAFGPLAFKSGLGIPYLVVEILKEPPIARHVLLLHILKDLEPLQKHFLGNLKLLAESWSLLLILVDDRFWGYLATIDPLLCASNHLPYLLDLALALTLSSRRLRQNYLLRLLQEVRRLSMTMSSWNGPCSLVISLLLEFLQVRCRALSWYNTILSQYIWFDVQSRPHILALLFQNPLWLLQIDPCSFNLFLHLYFSLLWNPGSLRSFSDLILESSRFLSFCHNSFLKITTLVNMWLKY